MTMKSNRPYLLKAFYEWIVDCDCTPYIAVDAHHSGVEVPQEFVTDGQIVLNVAPRAVSNFEMNHQFVAFTTRFGGIPIDIMVPVAAVMGIYAHENGQGMVFELEEDPENDPPPIKGPTVVTSSKTKKKSSKSKDKPSLRVVK
ncbi:ClpXP protease specificity-enhancing factor [Porticoccaceae bacterium]|jgi:stringent starvation protein B|nr:ClpXP protease specificity-enhancing factor [Porticoccaceae bacterium]